MVQHMPAGCSVLALPVFAVTGMNAARFVKKRAAAFPPICFAPLNGAEKKNGLPLSGWPFLFQRFLFRNQSGNVIQRNIIKFRQRDQMPQGNFILPFFIPGVDLLRCFQQLRNLRLPQIVVFPQIPYDFIIRFHVSPPIGQQLLLRVFYLTLDMMYLHYTKYGVCCYP